MFGDSLNVGVNLNDLYHSCSNPDLDTFQKFFQYINSHYNEPISVDVVLIDTANDASYLVTANIPDANARELVLFGTNYSGLFEYLRFIYDSTGKIVQTGYQNYQINPKDLFTAGQLAKVTSVLDAANQFKDSSTGKELFLEVKGLINLMSVAGGCIDTNAGEGVAKYFSRTFDQENVNLSVVLTLLNKTSYSNAKRKYSGVFNLMRLDDTNGASTVVITAGSGNFTIDEDDENKLVLSGVFSLDLL